MNSVLYKIMPSKRFGGIGVFALRPISKGTVLDDRDDDDCFVSWEEFHGLDKVTQQVIMDFCPQDRDGFYGLKDLNYLTVPMHMNHSCNPNVGSNEDGNFVAIKNVKAGEELCFDYALVMSNPDYRLECRCGSQHCRGVVTGNDWKNPKFIKKNYQYMPPMQRELVDGLLMKHGH